MKILTKENACHMLGGQSPDDFVSQLVSRLPLVRHTYSISPDSGRKTALARLFAYLLLRNSNVCIYVSGWGVWESSENLDLFYGYRRSFGENRPLVEAPVHLFDQSEENIFISILCMVFYFIWDAWIFDIRGKTLVEISHDEWLGVQSDDEDVGREFAIELENYGMPPLT